MNKRNLVYSTDPDWQKEEEEKNSAASVPLSGQTAHIYRERKGRKGKTVTVVKNLQGDLKSLQKDLQRHCGSGGSLKNGQIEIQATTGKKLPSSCKKRGVKQNLSADKRKNTRFLKTNSK